MDKRILHLVHTPRLSGAETLVRELMLHQGSGYVSAVASLNPPAADFQEHVPELTRRGAAVYFPPAPLVHFGRIAHLKSAYRDFRPDVVFGHSVLPALYGRLALPLVGARPRFVSVLHSATNDDYDKAPLLLTELLLARRADQVIAVSEQGARRYRQRIPHGRLPRVIPNGISLAHLRYAAAHRARHRAAFGLQSGDQLILQVGRLSPIKQQLLTFESLLPLLREAGGLQLWFAGLAEDAGYAEKLQAGIVAAGLSPQVQVLGSRPDVPELLAAADLYVMPSLLEAHSVALIEALASGVPVLASDIPAFRFAARYDGVVLREAKAPLDVEQVRRMLASDTRYERDLDFYAISRTAASYQDVADQLCRS
jgi:glycosyltransferase involved in cell wall biosynthesis